ncbi:esterase/lipase family protein [Chloroflexota bacterium]
MKRLLLLVVLVLCISITGPDPVWAAPEAADNVKELNFVFLHGMGAHSCSLQLLEDSIITKLTAYVTNYEHNNPNIKINTDTLRRCYPNNVDIDTWAHSIADSINEQLPDKRNLVLIGHSMGGKTALYTVAHNVGNLADKVAMVVTINSPIKSLVNYYYVGGDTALDYWGAQKLISSQGVLESLVNYDSSRDGQKIGSDKHWLAFTSCESSPLSSQFDLSGIDALPRNMDDTIVPISAQYADGADVVYYGEYAHSDFSNLREVSDYLADQILRYIFGGKIECSVFSRAGTLEHKANLFPGTDHWQDLVGGVLTNSGALTHWNSSYFKWQEWEDIVSEYSVGSARSSYQLTQDNSFPILTGIIKSGWANAGNSDDSRIYLKTRAAPRSTVQVYWNFYLEGLLPTGINRDHYEIELETGSQFTSIGQVSWETNNQQDVRLRIWSEAESPFRWFKAKWKVYFKENRQREIIDEFTIRSMAE